MRRHERRHARISDHRAQVHVLVELEPDPEQQVALEDPGLHSRIADRAQQDRVARPELVELGVGQDVAGSQEPLGPQVELPGKDLEPVADRVEHLERLADDLGPGAVAADHAEPVRPGHAMPSVVVATSFAATWSARLIAAR